MLKLIKPFVLTFEVREPITPDTTPDFHVIWGAESKVTFKKLLALVMLRHYVKQGRLERPGIYRIRVRHENLYVKSLLDLIEKF